MRPVGARKAVTLRGLRVFADQTAETIALYNPAAGHGRWWLGCSKLSYAVSAISLHRFVSSEDGSCAAPLTWEASRHGLIEWTGGGW